MGLEATTIAAIGLGVSTVGMVMQYDQSRKAAKESSRARQAQMAADQLKAQRERRNVIREAQQKRAAAVAMGEAAGVSGSSGLAGATGSAASQGASNVGFLNSQIAASDLSNQALANAAGAQSKAALFGSIGNFGSGLFSQAGGFETLFTKVEAP